MEPVARIRLSTDVGSDVLKMTINAMNAAASVAKNKMTVTNMAVGAENEGLK